MREYESHPKGGKKREEQAVARLPREGLTRRRR
jgi:hypothetical protein